MLVPSIPVVFRTALFDCFRRHRWKLQSTCHCFILRSQPSLHLRASASFSLWKSSKNKSITRGLSLSSLPKGTDGTKKKGEAIMKEIQETRNRMKERMEEMTQVRCMEYFTEVSRWDQEQDWKVACEWPHLHQLSSLLPWQRENIWTIPNLLCVTRITLTPWLSYLVIHDSFEMALGLFAFAGITDLVSMTGFG